MSGFFAEENVMRLDHIGIAARDIQKSLDFYINALGLRELERLQLVGREFIFVGNDQTRIEIEAAPELASVPQQPCGLGHMALIVNNLNEIVERVRSRGHKVPVPPIQLRPDRRIAFIEDPDGARIQLIEFV